MSVLPASLKNSWLCRDLHNIPARNRRDTSSLNYTPPAHQSLWGTSTRELCTLKNHDLDISGVLEMLLLLVTHRAQCGHDVASHMEAQVFSSHKASHHKAQCYGSYLVFKEHSGTPLPYSRQLQQPGKAVSPTPFYPAFPPKSTLHSAISLPTPFISLRLTFWSLHMHTVCFLHSAGDKERRGRGHIPLQEMLIGLFQPSPFKMYCYGPTNSTPRGDIPQINDYLRISHAAVPKAYGWLCRKDYCSEDEYRWLKQPGQGPVLPLQLSIKILARGLSTCIWHLLEVLAGLHLVIMKGRKSFAKRKESQTQKKCLISQKKSLSMP